MPCLPNMVRKLRWTRRALGRLDEIAAYIARDNPARAETFVGELRAKVSVLTEYQLGEPGRIFGTKVLVIHKHHLAVYRLKDDEVHVLTILHTAQER